MKPLRGELRQQEPMAKHTTWRVGGIAKQFYIPADQADLINFIRQLPTNEPLYFIGLGSNLLIRDGGIQGTVIATSPALAQIKTLDSQKRWISAGTPCAHIARQTARDGLLGGAFFAGIPGALGGALSMNAGAFGGETWPLVNYVETINRQGQIQRRDAQDYEINYRHIQAKFNTEEYFLAAVLEFETSQNPNASQLAAQQIKKLLQQRKTQQPTHLPSCGSVFKNPSPYHAAKLIQDCGLKGQRIGDACISEKHANFIVNLGAAKATEIETLIQLIQAKVLAQTGIALIPEVKIIGTTLAQ